MDDGIDTGAIISQVRIPMTDDLDAGLLYQLSFKAEEEVFIKAFERKFDPLKKQISDDNDIQYSFDQKDLYIDLDNDSPKKILQKVRAFSTKNKGARICILNSEYIVNSACVISNAYFQKLLFLGGNHQNGEVVLQFENCIIIYVKDVLMKFEIKNISER